MIWWILVGMFTVTNLIIFVVSKITMQAGQFSKFRGSKFNFSLELNIMFICIVFLFSLMFTYLDLDSYTRQYYELSKNYKKEHSIEYNKSLISARAFQNYGLTLSFLDYNKFKEIEIKEEK